MYFMKKFVGIAIQKSNTHILLANIIYLSSVQNHLTASNKCIHLFEDVKLFLEFVYREGYDMPYPKNFESLDTWSNFASNSLTAVSFAYPTSRKMYGGTS